MSVEDELAHLPFSLRSKIVALDAKQASLRSFVEQLRDVQRRLDLKADVVEAVIDRVSARVCLSTRVAAHTARFCV